MLNVDIWQKIDPLADEIKPHFVHIEAHKGHPGNTRCDLLAVAAATQKDEKIGRASCRERVSVLV